MRAGKLIRAVAVGVVVLSLAACGGGAGGGGSQGGDKSVAVGSKNFTEQFVLGELYAQALEADGYTVETKLNLGSEQIADQALQSGEIDMYPEYTGTSLGSIFKVENLNSFKEPSASYERAKELYAKRDPAATLLPYANFNNNFCIVVRKDAADEYGLKTISDLEKAAPNLVFASYSEFENRADARPNVEKNYPGFKNFKDTVIVNDIGLRYKSLAEGEAQVGVGFLTDGQLTSDQLVVLEDTKQIWPLYYPAPVVRNDFLKQNPDARETINSVTETLDAETMQQLNGRVDLQKEDPEDVAAEHLQQAGIVE
ncbi:MAG: glycine/betaine ABC transporter substrate-binding protein [Actinomycetota bacterium]|nr:glycine/betaine ABC transporter substrate-binding protein [Actinomycetota bacterium]MDP9479489.1 glycine/betaine ABC transporter substrate-binding protein [Actinomycetota bacterium]MDP9484625.1 glycine/betaine ABC transporter substrate-binding protein [Actinomycetota bacterium]